jgi:hypothetical protein
MDVPMLTNKRGNKKRSKQTIGGPLFVNPDGTLQSRKSCSFAFWYSPYGKGGMTMYSREIAASLIKEFFGVLLICVMLPQFAAAAAGADPVSRAIFIGLIAGASIFAASSWGYNDRLPRHLDVGATIVQFMSWNINWVLGILNLLVGFTAAVIAAAILYATGTCTVPIIGGPNRTDIAGAVFVELLATLLIAYSVLDQKTTKLGEPKVFKNRAKPASGAAPTDGCALPGSSYEGSAANPIPNRAYQEDISRRPWLYGAVVFLMVSFCFFAFGIWTFNSYVYFAAGLGTLFISGGTTATSDPFNNIVPGVVSTRIAGSAALFFLVPVLAWIIAFFVDWLMYYLHNNEPRMSEFDDSSYHSVNEEFDIYEEVPAKKISNVAAKKRNVEVNSQNTVKANYDSSLWTDN